MGIKKPMPHSPIVDGTAGNDALLIQRLPLAPAAELGAHPSAGDDEPSRQGHPGHRGDSAPTT
jgi:hypothetical protein